MELCVNDKVIEKPTPDDIVRALDATSFPEDWFMTLETDTGAMLDAVAQEGGHFALVHVDKDLKRKAVPDVDAVALKPIFVKFLNAEPDWDAGCHWRVQGSAQGQRKMFKFVPASTVTTPGKSGDGPPSWAIVTMVGIILLVTLLFVLPDWVGPGVIPYSNSDYYYIGLIFLPMIALIALIVISKTIEFQRAKNWSQTTGTVVRSEIEARHHRFAGEAKTVKNVPVVEYEFTAAGRKIRGSRIGIGDDAGGANTEATLARFPVGATVTVYYDPADPTSCVLERGGPPLAKGEATKGCLGGLVLLALFGGAIAWLVTRGPAFVELLFPHANAPFAIFATCFGLAVLLFYIAARRYAKRAAKWPTVRGTIVASAVEKYEERDSSGSLRIAYRPAVEYSYAVNGRDYRGTQIRLMVQISGSEAAAAKVVARYPAGGAVDVHYDPNDPSTAALENSRGGPVILLLLALACFALAVWQLGIFK